MPGPINSDYLTYAPYPQGSVVVTEVIKRRSRGPKPYVPRPYYYSARKVVKAEDTRYPGLFGADIEGANLLTLTDFQSDFSVMYNSCYEKFKNKLGQSAGLGINAVQGRQAMEMITRRSLQMVGFVQNLRKFNFGKAAESLGMTVVKSPVRKSRFESKDLRKKREVDSRKLRRKAKAFADNFLEFHFGWEPIVKDIYSAIDVLQRRFPSEVIRVASSRAWNHTYFSSTSPVTGLATTTYDYKYRMQMCAYVSVSNPNLRFADLLGLINPATVAFDAVPFSFVLGWFVNVEQVLSSFTDFAGLSILNPCITKSLSGTTTQIKAPGSSFTWTRNIVGRKFELQRELGLGSGPTLRVKQPWSVSPTRGLTAISLLLQKMR